MLNSVNTSAYLHVCSSQEANSLTLDILNRENEDIKKRDFTGLDCNAWVYDLFRPDEAYENRGTHPSSTGINRYITWSKLTKSEKRYLKKQYYFSYLNFIDPFLINKRYFHYNRPDAKSPIDWNANLKHYLTPFGYAINAHLFMRHAHHNLLLTLHNYFNQYHYFPGLTLETFNIPINVAGIKLRNDLRISLWSQPQALDFSTSKAKIGSHLSIKSKYQWTKALSSYWQMEYKTHGWLAGNVYLSNNFSIRLGLSIDVEQ